MQSLVAARYSEPAAKRLVRDTVPGLRPSLEGWNEVVALRRECGLLPKPEPRYERGYGALYQRHITQADAGCDFDFLEGTAPTNEPEIH